ncbi:hypothetical protein TELCIR_09660 [Teladorsagia circumcincta]|uniref:Uncharacterized protein n=1 Tax=Teladorsagia circumcincta TaxID=45464 RepID=A0A2G9UEB0_TELCI|nr:hypothetical protein TELCIR_09660 [Teladorsagia circumcincta]
MTDVVARRTNIRVWQLPSPIVATIDMRALLVLLSIITLSLACTPKTSTTAGAGGGSGASKKAKRDVREAEVVVVTHQSFDPKMTDSYMAVVKSVVEKQAEDQGIITHEDHIKETAKNIDGKFAVAYTIFDADCAQLKDFITSAKEKSAIIQYATVTCNGEKIDEQVDTG